MNKKTILIIEDELTLLQRYSEYAAKFFSDVLTAKNLEEAKSFLVGHEVDCILSDNRLPDGEGISLIQELPLRSKKIPVVIITAYADKQLAIDSVNAGVFHFIEKPVSKDKLMEILKECRAIVEEQVASVELNTSYVLSVKAKEVLEKKYMITQREMEIMAESILMSKNNVIAKKLFISEGTVKRHLHNIFEKLSISTKEEMQELVKKLNL